MKLNMKLAPKMRILVIFLIIPFLFNCEKNVNNKNTFVHPKAFYSDWLSRRAMGLKQNQLAHDLILNALETENSPGLIANLGITFDLLEKKEDAEKSFLSALQSSITEEEKFKFNFNLGALYGAQKKISQALEHYQAALDIVPTSIETKHNIELLIQQQQQDQKNDKDNKDKKDGDGKGQNNDEKKEDKDKKDDKDGDGKDKKDDKKETGKDRSKAVSPNAKYKPRPYQGDQLTEGDVKKILGEISQQDQKIRSNFNKKDQRKEDRNEKDW